MNNIYQSATVVRSNFSDTIDKAIYDRPQFINRTKDHAILVGSDIFDAILSSIRIHYDIQYDKQSNTYVLTTSEISDIIGCGTSKEEAILDLCSSLLEYANEYYAEFGLYSRTPNRKEHLPFVVRILMLGDVAKIKKMLVCREGKN